MIHKLIVRCALAVLLLASSQVVRAAFDLQITISSSAAFSPTQRALLLDSLAEAEALWEGVITGYQPGISVNTVTISVGSVSEFAHASLTNTVDQGGYRVTDAGELHINPQVIDLFTAWNGTPGPVNPPLQYLGLNYVDDILAHEVGHVLGIGTLWQFNNVYINNSFQYTGQYGVAAYRKEFDPLATFVPVEDADLIGTQNAHWNQRMRSAPAPEGDPNDPWSLDPRVGITNAAGRDFASELMTGALDPDYGEPFLSLTTIQSLRDLGFTVVPEPASIGLCAFVAGLLAASFRMKRRS